MLVQRISASSVAIGALALAACLAGCSVEANPTAGIRGNAHGDAVIVAPRCTDERIVAVQVADLDGPVRWRVEGGGNASTGVFVVGREPPLMRETDPLEGPLDPHRAYVATIEYAGTLPDVDVEFHASSLSTDRVTTADGEDVVAAAFADEADHRVHRRLDLGLRWHRARAGGRCGRGSGRRAVGRGAGRANGEATT